MATLKPTILLIPGLWHTPECFNALRTELEEYGYETVSRQLPSIDCTDPSKHSAQSDADFVRSQLLLPLLDSGKRVVEVMHSYGGIPGSAAAYGLSEEERNKEGLKGGVVGLIFVASYVIPVEKTCSTCDADTEHPPMVGFNMEEDGNCTITPEGAIHHFYNDLPTKEAQAWALRIKPAAFPVLVSQVHRTAHAQPVFRKRRSYIHCKKDTALPFDLQKRFVAASGIQHVVTLDTDHSPFLSMPKKLAEIMVEQIDGFA